MVGETHNERSILLKCAGSPEVQRMGIYWQGGESELTSLWPCHHLSEDKDTQHYWWQGQGSTLLSEWSGFSPQHLCHRWGQQVQA